jgi:GntR family transcriptional regulator, sialic acid-inducible nan operon repressor
MAANGERIEKRKLSEEVLDRLIKLIESGKVRAGDRLPSERELMAQYGVGRPAVREALQSLEKMGLIGISHGERAKLENLEFRSLFGLIDRSARHLLNTSPKTVEHLTEARLFFEAGMVRLAVLRGDDEGFEVLKQRLEEMRRASSTKAFVTADMAFHEAVAGCTKNPLYSILSEFLLRWLFEHHPKMVRVPGAEKITITEHQAICDRITARDEEGAVAAMTRHLNRANPLYARLGKGSSASKKTSKATTKPRKSVKKTKAAKAGRS